MDNFIQKLQYFFDDRNVIENNRIEFSIDDLEIVLDGFIKFFLRYKQAVNDDMGLVLFQTFMCFLNKKLEPYSNDSKRKFKI